MKKALCNGEMEGRGRKGSKCWVIEGKEGRKGGNKRGREGDAVG